MRLPFVSRLKHDQLALDLVRAQDEIRGLNGRVAALELDLQAAEIDSRQSRERVTDWMAERMFGKPIYGHSPSLAEASPTEAQTAVAFAPKRIQAREVARDLTAKFFAEAGMAGL